MTGQSNVRGVQSLKLGAAAQMLPLIASYGVNLLATPYVVSRLGLHDFGIWSITGGIALYAALFDLGISRAAIRYVALFHARGDIENERSVVGVCVTVLIGLGCILYAIPLLIPGFLDQVLRTGDPALAQFLVVCSATMLVCGLLARALVSASIGRGRQVPANVGFAVLGVAQVVGGVVALVGSPTLRSFALGTAVGAGIGLCAVVAAILFDERRIVIGRPKAALAREILAFGIKGQVQGAADIVTYQSGKLIAGLVIGPAAAGAYELGSRLALGVQAFGSASSVALTSHLTRAYALGGKADILAQFSRLTRRFAAVAIFLPLLLGATSFSAVPLWLGGRHDDVVMVVAALAPGIAVNVSTAVCTASMLAMGRSGIISATATAVAAISVALALPLAHAFGFKGIVGAFGCSIVVGNLLAVWFLQSRMGISMKEYLRAIRGPFALGFVAILAALPIGIIAMPKDRASALIPFLLSSAIFCTIYVILGWHLDYLPRFRGGGKKSPSHIDRLLPWLARVQHPVTSHLPTDEPPREPPVNREEVPGNRRRTFMTTLPADSFRDAGNVGVNAPVGSVAIIGTRGYPSFYGGFETLVRKLAPFLADRGWQVTVYGRPGGAVDSAQYQRKPIRTLTTKGIESKSLSTLTFGATSILDASKRRPDVALVMNVANGYWLPMLWGRGIPSVVNVDGIEWQRDKWSKLGKAVFKLGAQLTARFGDLLISDSKQIGAFWEKNFDRSSVFIPYGGDLPDKVEPMDGLERRGYVLLVARFVPENTVAEFLDAAERITQRYPLVIVGSSGSGGPLEARVRSLSASNSAVTWLGHLADDQKLYSLWQNCGAYFHGHSVGGTNPALVQAMACGAPIIARDTVFNREVLLDGGLFVEPHPQDIANAVEALLSHTSLQESLSSRAQARARTWYSWEAICTQYEAALHRAMDMQCMPSRRFRSVSVNP